MNLERRLRELEARHRTRPGANTRAKELLLEKMRELGELAITTEKVVTPIQALGLALLAPERLTEADRPLLERARDRLERCWARDGR